MVRSGIITWDLMLLVALITRFGSVLGTPAVRPVPPPDPAKVELYISSSHHPTHGYFMSRVMDLILNKGVFFDAPADRKAGPLDYQTLGSIAKLVDIKLSEAGTTHAAIFQTFEKIIKYSPHPSHPYMLDKRVSGLDPYALAGDWLAATMSNLVVTFQVSPVWTLMELEMAKKLSDLIGWGGTTRGDGVPTTGAGVANSMALTLALQAKYPEMKSKGLFGRTKVPVIFLSEHASYAFEKAAAYQGVAAKNMVKVKVDGNGRMDVEDLKAKIMAYSSNAKFQLVMVVGTAGTQVLGQIDPLDKIAEVCAQNRLWFHVDAEKAAMFQFLRPIPGISKAHSVTFGTWLMSTPYLTVMLMTRSPTVLHDTFGLHAPYVWTGLDLYNQNYDTGDHTIQTSRRPEISKFWFMWKARGTKGMVAHLTKVKAAAKYFVDAMRKKPTVFIPIIKDFDLPLISFYVVATTVKGTDFEKLSTEMKRVQTELTSRKLMVVSISSLGAQLVGTGIAKHPKYFLTVSLTNSLLGGADVDYILKVIEAVANNAATTSFAPPNRNGLPAPTVNSPVFELHDRFFKDIFYMFNNVGIFFSKSSPPSHFLQPADLYRSFDFRLGSEPDSHATLLSDFRKIIRFSPHWGQSYFIYQLAAGLDPYTLVADYLASAMSTPMINWRDNPVFTLMETELLTALRKRIFKSPKGDGIITDGGSMANQMAIALAKQSKIRKLGDLRTNGITGNKKFIVFISEDGHYSTAKGGILQGLGTNNVVNVKATKEGRMIPSELIKMIDAAIAKGDVPFMVVITTGTTVYGAIDPVRALVAVCRRYDLWCHADGMFGGLLVMSDRHIKSLDGIDGVDSFGADLHKLFGSTMVCSCLVTREEGIFKKTFGVISLTDFSSASDYDASHGGKYWQVDKRNNMLKFWVLWKAKGRVGMGQHVDKIMQNSAILVQELKKRKDRGFLPLLDKFEVTNVCFYYIPPSMMSMQINTDDWKAKIGVVAFYIEKSVTTMNIMNVVSQKRISSAEKTGTFIKFVMMGSSLTTPDIMYLLDTIEYFGKQWDVVERLKPGQKQYIAEHANEDRFEPFGNQPPKRGNQSEGTMERTGEVKHKYPHPGFRVASKNGPKETG